MPSEASLRVNVELTAEDIAGLFEAALATLPLMQRATVMNRLLHDHPRVFHALLAKPPRNGESPFAPTHTLH